MTYMLIMCFNMHLGLCREQVTAEFPNYQQCRKEREYIRATVKRQPYYAVCRPIRTA